MALRLSTGLRDRMMEGASFKQIFAGGKIELYTGSQPTVADDAVAGTLLNTYTDASGAHTAEVLATGSVELTGGASGSVDTLTVNSIEIMGSATPFNTTLTQTAADIAEKINNNPKNMLFTASNGGGVTVTITAKSGLGTLPNGWVVASTVTTITTTDVNMASGVASINGLLFTDADTGALVKDPDQVWSGVAGNTGTAGWFRLVGPVVDAGGSSAVLPRLDGNVATSGANLNLSSTTITATATQTISTFTVTMPAA